MEIPSKTLRNGFSMPVFGLGTWKVGGEYEPDHSHDSEEIESIERAIAAGITHIDTAEMYSGGHSEELVGQAMKSVAREKIFLVSKVSPENLHEDDLLRSAEASLKRLQTEYLDLYLIHKPNPSIPLEETMRAMDKLKDSGMIKNIGVSNFTVERQKKAQSLTQNPIVATQVHLNLKFREPERKGLLQYCQDEDVMFIAWRPVRGAVEENSKLMDELCTKYGKTPVQIAINWLISQKNVVTLAKMVTKEHLDENLGALGWEMEQEDVERLRKEFPDQQDESDAVPLL